MKNKIAQIQENSRMIEDIADCLLEDHIDLMNENAALRAENAKLKELIEEGRGAADSICKQVLQVGTVKDSLTIDAAQEPQTRTVEQIEKELEEARRVEHVARAAALCAAADAWEAAHKRVLALVAELKQAKEAQR